ncbi:MAG: 50S ribosomal protein L29 [Kiritimatiellia bacterium]
MKAPQIREQTDEEIRETFADTKKELLNLRVKQAGGDSSQQPLRVRSLRRDMARIKTVMRERGIKT